MLIVLSLLSTHASTVQPRAQPVEADGITTTVAVFMRAHALRGDDNTTDHTDNQRLQHSVDSFQTVYAQPIGAMDVPTHVFVNPSPWPLPNITAAKATVSVLWQRGYPQVSLEVRKPLSWLLHMRLRQGIRYSGIYIYILYIQ